jgi:predicted amidohydrolase
VRIHLLQLAYGDDEPVADRVARVAALVRAQRAADLVVLPELWAPGGFAARHWAERAQTLRGSTVQALSAAARDVGAMVHGGSIIERAPGPLGRDLWNTSVVLGPDGSVRAVYRKVHRFGFGSGEPRLLEAGEDLVTVPVAARDGSQVTTAGLATCYDLRFPELFRALLDAGARMFVVPAAWPAARVDHWTLLGRARAVEDQCVVVQCNTAGTHARTPMGGRSQVVDPLGRVLAEAGTDEEVLEVEVDVAAVEQVRAGFPVLGDRRL